MAKGHTRNILLLQGPSSLFFAKLGQCLRKRGAQVWRVVFCPGDALYWRATCGTAVPFRGSAEEWNDFLSRLTNSLEITDLVCLGDTRWQHRTAIEALGKAPINIHVVEHGYLRPGWLTVERDGIGPNSTLPKTSEGVLDLARGLADQANPSFTSSFLEYAGFDIGYHLANLTTGCLWFPKYRRHALDHPVREWAGWIRRFLRRASTRRKILETLAKIENRRMFLVPLQLETDFQIRLHGPRGGQIPQIARQIKSFARNAPQDTHLVFKMHPLDNGWTPWEVTVAEAAKAAQVTARCHFIEGGDLAALLEKSSGVITVNSSVGLEAIAHGIPVHLSGNAVYRVEGLADFGPLDKFWRSPKPPDPALADAFIRLLKNRAMLPGAFDGSGASVGASAIANRIIGKTDGGVS